MHIFYCQSNCIKLAPYCGIWNCLEIPNTLYTCAFIIELSKLEQNDFTIFKSWINKQDELFQFAGTILKLPVTFD